MIYGFVQTVQDDASALIQWVKGENLKNNEEEDQQQRIQAAALRMLAIIGMAFGALWTLSLLVSIITVAVKLIVATTIYVVSHDIFVMIQNAFPSDSQDETEMGYNLIDLFIGKEELDEEETTQFTQGTFLQSAWMWAYKRRLNEA